MLFVKNEQTMKKLCHFQIMHKKHIFHGSILLSCALYFNHNLRSSDSLALKLMLFERRLKYLSNNIWFVKNEFKTRELWLHEFGVEMLNRVWPS